MGSIIAGALLSIVGKLVTSEFIEAILIHCAEILVKKTDNTHDDEIVAKAKEILGRK